MAFARAFVQRGDGFDLLARTRVSSRFRRRAGVRSVTAQYCRPSSSMWAAVSSAMLWPSLHVV